MSVNTYLKNHSSKCIVQNMERLRIDKSLKILKKNLREYFGDEIKEQFVFGSYSRRTILPRKYDERSDVDYMVVFSQKDAVPQTYLDRLRRFAEDRYSRTEICQSNPTIILSLNHIRFELVPAISHWWSSKYKIPAKASDYKSWIATNPDEFKETLLVRNEEEESRLKPLIRLMKSWNSHHNYPFESYELEQLVVAHDYSCWPFQTKNLKKHFYSFVLDSLSVDRGAAQWKKDAVSKAQTIVRETKQLEKDSTHRVRPRNKIKKLFPSESR